MTQEKVRNRLEHDLSGDHHEQDDILTIVLTADNHLGSTAFSQQPRKREERQQRLRHAFQQATEFAIGQGVDLFVQAGDLFDTTDPGERDRSFVAARLAQLRQAGIRTFALGGVHDTPAEMHTLLTVDPADLPGRARVSEDMLSAPEDRPLEDGRIPAPQISYARLGALHYFAPNPAKLEPVMLKVRDMHIAICGLGVLAGQEGNPLARVIGKQGEAVYIQSDLERADISLLLLHAPIEGLTTGPSLLDIQAQVSRASIENQSAFRYILAGYHHDFHQLHIGHCDVIIAGATQHIDFSNPSLAGWQEPRPLGTEVPSVTALPQEPGFVFLGLGASGIRWCKHIAVDALLLQRLVIHTSELWPDDGSTASLLSIKENQADTLKRTPTGAILERLRLLCSEDAMVQLRLEGQLTRNQYHQLDLNQIRRYGEDHCFALAIDDSGLDILPVASLDTPLTGEEAIGVMSEVKGAARSVERFSPREELVALADEWIAATNDEQEKKALRTTKEELLATMDEVAGTRFNTSHMYHSYSLSSPGGSTQAGKELPC